MRNLSIRQLDDMDVEQLRDSWMSVVNGNDELPETSYEKAVSWVEDVHAGNVQTAGVEVHGVFDESGTIHAVFDLVRVRPQYQGGFFKILSMVISPTHDLMGVDDDDQDSRAKAIDGIAHTVAEVIVHGLNLLREYENAKKIKFFASGDVTLNMLHKAFSAIEDNVANTVGFQTSVYGNWAEFKRPL